jgi:Kdo2-lipid IVA lauroyltransferase/acyltransferase
MLAKILLFTFLLPVLYALALLPMPVLYGLSTGVRLLVYDLLKYRVRVVRNNLQHAFPEKTEAERRTIERKFYQNLVDMILEKIKELTWSKAAKVKRLKPLNPAELKPFAERAAAGERFVSVIGHMGNWELVGAGQAPAQMGYRAVVIYTPLTSPFFEWLFVHTRLRSGMGLIDKRRVKQEFPMWLQREPVAVVFVADQAARPETAYWTHYLHQPTPVFRGAEKYAREYNLSVLYFSVRKLTRGHYGFTVQEIARHPRDWAPDAITEAFTRQLELDIQRQPDIWLWSHRRWKHRKPEELTPPTYTEPTIDPATRLPVGLDVSTDVTVLMGRPLKSIR